jgi:carbonic anhydrase/acetyltransferase-like protein (isoleucine patch superfamily)
MLSRIARFLVLRSLRFCLDLLDPLYRTRTCLDAWVHGGAVVWGISSKVEVLVRCDGSGKVEIGDGVNLGVRSAPRLGSGEILLQARCADSSISIGNSSALSNNVSVIAAKSVRIGRQCLIGDSVFVMDCDFHEVNPLLRESSSGSSAPVIIEDNVWLGSRVLILKGVTIGKNSVVAAGAVVSKSLPANVVAAGVPAKVVRSIN